MFHIDWKISWNVHVDKETECIHLALHNWYGHCLPNEWTPDNTPTPPTKYVRDWITKQRVRVNFSVLIILHVNIVSNKKNKQSQWIVAFCANNLSSFTMLVIIHHPSSRVGLNRPVSASSNSLFKGLQIFFLLFVCISALVLLVWVLSIQWERYLKELHVCWFSNMLFYVAWPE
jgi:hypothetical protein